MNEVRALVEALDEASTRAERCALATVVSVEGSSYRRPGAKMLVFESGGSVGAISAGCLESDVIEHGKAVVRDGMAKLVEYNTASGSEELAWGLGLGCTGIVRVLVEPVAKDSLYIQALRRSLEPGSQCTDLTVVTVFDKAPSNPKQYAKGMQCGSRILITAKTGFSYENLSPELATALKRELDALPRERTGTDGCVVQVGGVEANVFIETVLPPIRLVIFGAGHDVLPIVDLARMLGWQTEVVDPQGRSASASRFQIADRVALARPEDVASHVEITPRTMTLLMSHNYSHDLALLGFLIASPALYVGVMGPHSRTQRMLEELEPGQPDVMSESNRARLFSPVGLDIGADSPAEIAMSIIAEMRAVLSRRGGGLLRARQGSIHDKADYAETAMG